MTKQPPPQVTWREAMDHARKLADDAADLAAKSRVSMIQEEEKCIALGMRPARTDDLEVYGSQVISRGTQPKSDDQKKAARDLRIACGRYQLALADKRHWTAVHRQYSETIEDDPAIADMQLSDVKTS